MVAANARTAITFSLSPGQAGDAPEGRALLQNLGSPNRPLHLLMDKAYEGDETRQLALDLGFIPVVPPKSNRLEPWEYDREMYRRRNEVERLFRQVTFSVIPVENLTRDNFHHLCQLLSDSFEPLIAAPIHGSAPSFDEAVKSDGKFVWLPIESHMSAFILGLRGLWSRI